MTPTEWLLSGDTGISSKTILSVMTGCAMKRGDIPHDPGDFGRCYRMLKHFPEWKCRLSEVAEKYPKWGPMVAAWDELTGLYEKEMVQRTAPKLYARMQEVADDCKIADGWEKTGPFSWAKKPV